MIGLLQRVTHAEVRVDERLVGAIEQGLLVLVGVERGDAEAQADRLLERLCTYRVFPDAEGRMNRSLQDIGGQLLLVSQFTLAASARPRHPTKGGGYSITSYSGHARAWALSKPGSSARACGFR
jgi:D-tyrosyl-tRNA(Tyr) deacylase